MNTSGVPERAYETHSKKEIINTNDESITVLIERCFGVRGYPKDNYLDVQREFGWDDTH